LNKILREINELLEITIGGKNRLSPNFCTPTPDQHHDRKRKIEINANMVFRNIAYSYFF